TRKCKEIDNLYDPNKNGDLRRTLANSTTPTANVVINLKQRVFKLELQLKQKETIIDEIKNDPRWTKSTELEIQNRALFNELEKEKLERLNYIQHDYMISLDEETKNAIRKLEADKRELKVENENLMKKVQELENLEHDKQLSPRKYDESTDRNVVHKMEKLKEMCEYYENELEQMKDDLKIMRRERDKYRDKLETLNEDFEEIKRERDQYRNKSDRQTNHSLKNNSTRSLNTSARRNSNSSEELSKTDSKSNTSIRKSNEDKIRRSSSIKFDRNVMSPSISRKSISSNRKLPRNDWTSDDEYRVTKFRENRAATVIQRSWRKHNRSRKNSLINKSRLNTNDRRNSKIVEMKTSKTQSPRASPHNRFGSKVDNLNNSTIKSQSSLNNMSNDSALKIVQASLRGYINRNEINQNSRIQTSHRRADDDDDDIFETSSSQFGRGTKRESFLNNSKKTFEDTNDKIGFSNRLPINNRDSILKSHRSSSPPLDTNRTSSLRINNDLGSKQMLSNDRNKSGLGNRSSIHDRELQSKQFRLPSPPTDSYQSSSPHSGIMNSPRQSLSNDRNKLGSGNRFLLNDRNSLSKQHHSSSPPANTHNSPSPRFGSITDSKQSLLYDKNKSNSGNPIDRDSSLKFQRSTSPINERRLSHHISSENIRPPSRQSNTSLRKSPINSKQSLKNTYNEDDDDDVLGF
ncbi:unnamed protein product, partial [Adineta steineri]